MAFFQTKTIDGHYLYNTFPIDVGPDIFEGYLKSCIDKGFVVQPRPGYFKPSAKWKKTEEKYTELPF